MLIDCETTDSNTRTQEVTKINKSSQEPQTVPEQVASIPFGVCSSRSQGPKAEIDTNDLPIEGERKGEIPLNEDMLNVIAFNYSFQHAGPSEVEETEGVYRKYLENVREIDSQIQSFRSTITLECGTLQFLEELWLSLVRLFKRPFKRNGVDFTRDKRDIERFRPRNGKALHHYYGRGIQSLSRILLEPNRYVFTCDSCMASSIRLSFILSELAAFRNQARYTMMKIKPAPAQMSRRTQFIRVNNKTIEK